MNNHDGTQSPNISIGIDTENIEWFKGLSRESDKSLLEHIFTSAELDYCYAKIDPSPCLCGRFCAKEAVIKVLASNNFPIISLVHIEITTDTKKGPKVEIRDNNFPEDVLRRIEIKVSISHSDQCVVSTALVLYRCDE